MSKYNLRCIDSFFIFLIDIDIVFDREPKRNEIINNAGVPELGLKGRA